MLCYRYMKFRDAKWSLEDGWFKTARPSELNDPFDCRLNFVGKPTDAVLWDYVNRDFPLIKARAIRVNPSLAKINIGRPFIYEKLRAECGWAEKFTKMMYAQHDETQRLICFSTAACKDECGDNLMWGHYAENGAGIRVGFDIDEHQLEKMCTFRHVDYKKEMPKVDLAKLKIWPADAENSWDTFIKCLFTKDCSWRYEDEVRLVILKEESCDPPVFQERFIDGKRLDFVRFPYEAIRTVDFGVRADETAVAKLVEELRGNPSARHIVFRKAALRNDVYGYAYVLI